MTEIPTPNDRPSGPRAARSAWLDTRIPPVAVFIAVAWLMYIAARATSGLSFRIPGQGALPFVLGAAGLAIIVAGIVSISRARTTIDPTRLEPTALVATGIFRYSRNPIYLGLLLELAALAVALGHPIGLIGVVHFVVYMNRYQIQPEERALNEKFGRAFEEYAASTRRWI